MLNMRVEPALASPVWREAGVVPAGTRREKGLAETEFSGKRLNRLRNPQDRKPGNFLVNFLANFLDVPFRTDSRKFRRKLARKLGGRCGNPRVG